MVGVGDEVTCWMRLSMEDLKVLLQGRQLSKSVAILSPLTYECNSNPNTTELR